MTTTAPHHTGSRSPDLLLPLVAGGDRSAFTELFDALSPRVLCLIGRVLRDPAQTEEVAQEVFLWIWMQSSRFDADRGNATSWIMRASHSHAVDRVRASQASRRRDHVIGTRDFDFDSDPVADDAGIRLEHERALRALELLSPLQREAIRLAYLEGLTRNEIAARLAVPVGTVATRIRDGLIRMREAMGSSESLALA